MKNKPIHKSGWLASLKGGGGSAQSSTKFRTQRFKAAVVSSVAGKGLSVALQLGALPFAISELGVTRYGIYAMIVALLNWLNMAGLVIAPGLTAQMIGANSNGKRDVESQLFCTAFQFVIILSILVFVGLEILFSFAGISNLFGAEVLEYQNEVQLSLHIMATLMAIGLLLSVVEAAQAAYQNQFVMNLLAILGSALSIVGIIFLLKESPTIPALIISIYGCTIFVKILNAMYLFWNRPYLLPWRGSFSRNALMKMISIGAAFLLTVAGTFLYQNFSIFWAGRKIGPDAAAQVSVMLLVVSMSGSVLMTVTQALWPAIQDAMMRKDFSWVSKAYDRMQCNLVPYILVASLLLGYFGQDILSFWLKTDVVLEPLLCILWGIYFFVIAWEHLNYTFLVGFGRTWFASIPFMLGAIVMLGVIILISDTAGLNGIFLGLCIGPIAITSWLYPLEIRKTLSIYYNERAF